MAGNMWKIGETVV